MRKKPLKKVRIALIFAWSASAISGIIEIMKQASLDLKLTAKQARKQLLR